MPARCNDEQRREWCLLTYVYIQSRILSTMLGALQRSARIQGRRALSTEPLPFLPRITDRRVKEEGAGGRATNAGVKVAVFGATGFLGKHVCYQLGRSREWNIVVLISCSSLTLTVIPQVKMVLMPTLETAEMKPSTAISNLCLI
jgi:hypothetical protein